MGVHNLAKGRRFEAISPIKLADNSLAFHSTMILTRNIPFALFSALLGVSQVLGAANPKRGLAFAEGDNPGDIKLANQTGTAISWTYNWGVTPPDYLKTSSSKLTYIAMQWGRGGIDTFAAAVKAQGAKTILVSALGYCDFDLNTHMID